MDEFLRKYSAFVWSSLYLTCALMLLGYATLVSPDQIAKESAQELFRLMKAEIDPLKKELAAKAKNAGDEEDAGIKSLPLFLTHINNTAKETGVIIKELTPSRTGDLRFILKVATDYRTFLKLAARLEALNLTINDLQVRPFKPTATPPEHAIEFSLTPRDNAAPLGGERLAGLKDLVMAPDMRNPFQRFAFNAKTRTVSRDIDLTWINKLSGIGKSGNQREATIEGRDYRVGDTLPGGQTITAIDADVVHLSRETPDGTETFVLRYQKSPFDTGTR